MGLLDYVYRLKPRAGDTSPVNDVGGAQPLTGGGAPALVDLGGGVYVWRFTGAANMATIGAKAIGATGGSTAGGVTIVVRAAIASDPGAADFRMLCLSALSASAGYDNGVQWRRSTGAGLVAAAFREAGSTTLLTSPDVNAGTSMRTWVFRLACDGTSGVQEVLDVWWSGGSATTTPDRTVTASLNVNHNLQYLHVNPGAGQLDIRDIIVYHSTKTPAECVSLLNIDTALAAPAPTITSNPASQTVTAGAAATFVAGADNATTYQWQRNGVDISGANGTAYTTPATTVTGGAANNGDVYRLGATGPGGGPVYSSAATLTVNSGSTLAGNVQLGDAVPGGALGTAPGIITITGVRNENNGLQAGVTVPWVTVQRLTDAVQVLAVQNQLLDVTTGNLALTNAALVAGTWYIVNGFNADGSKRMIELAQAT